MSLAVLKTNRSASLYEYEGAVKLVRRVLNNKRLLIKALASLKSAWEKFKLDHNAFAIKATDAQTELDQYDEVALNYLEVESEGEEALENLEAAERGPPPDPRQAITFLISDLNMKKEQILASLTRLRKEIDEREFFSSVEASAVSTTLEKIEEDRQMHLSLNKELRERDPMGEAERSDSNFILQTRLDEEVYLIRRDLSRKTKTPESSSSPPNSSISESNRLPTYKDYERDKIPSFSGEIRDYPEFKREWLELVQPGRPEQWVLVNLNKNTPKEADLRNCRTVEECWLELDAKYGNPTNVSGTLIRDFLTMKLKARGDASRLMEIRTEVLKLFNDLQTVRQQEQLSKNEFLLNHVVQLMPRDYQRELGNIRMKEEGGTKSLWDIIESFLRETGRRIEIYEPWLLDSASVNSKGGGSQRNIKCYECSKEGHTRAQCPNRTASINGLNIKNQSWFDRRKSEVGACPCCQDFHTYRPSQGPSAGYDLPSDSFRSCTKFLQSDELTRANIVSANKACAVCLRWSHEREACQKTRPCGQLTGGQACQLMHSPLLHGTDVAYVNVARSSNDSIILQMSKHKFKNNGMETVIFFDPGSTTSIIRHQLARKMKLKGVPKSFEIYRAGMKSPDILKTTEYTVPLREIDGTMSVRQMIGLDWITNKQTHSPDLVTIRSMFPHIPPEAIQYPTGEVGMLLGQDCGSLLPTGGEGRNSVGDLKIMTVKFGTGYVLSGKASAKPRVKASFSPEASAITNALLVTDNKAIHVNFLSCREPNFLECEEMAVSAPRKCLRCTRCQTCNFQRIEMSRKEEAEMRMMEENTWLDANSGRIHTTYPVVGDLSKLRDNRWQAVKMAENLERRLLKNDKLENYNEEFQSFVNRGVLSEVSNDDIEAWKNQGGIINYISHHGVESDSSSTPLRIVSNSSLRNCGKGPSINELWAKGPDSLNSLYDVLIRWRSYEKAVVWDIRKAYHQILTTPKEKFLRLLVWRFGNNSEEFRTFGYEVVAFGDKPAAGTLERGKDIVAELGMDNDPEVALKLKNDMYVDDAVSGGPEELVSRMRGKMHIKENGDLFFDGVIPEMLRKAGMEVKAMICSGETNQLILSKLDGPVLGHFWSPPDDTLKFDLASCVREAETIRGEVTKRSVLSLVNSFFDPMGVMSPYLLKYKLFMRRIVSKNLEWDEVLPLEDQKEWEELKEETRNMDPIILPRSVRPSTALGDPELILFTDGSIMAYGAVVFIRWKLIGQGEYVVNLLTSKTKVTPTLGMTAPRAELNALLLGTRLLGATLRALKGAVSRVHTFLDSQCVISAVESDSIVLNPYFANRVSEHLEIREGWKKLYPHIALEELHHISGPLNPADLATRGKAIPEDMKPGTLWNKGPGFLGMSRECWPVSRDVKGELPAGETRKGFAINLLETAPSPVKNDRLWKILEYSNSLNTVRGILARLLKSSILGNRESIKDPLEAVDYKRADFLLLLLSQRETEKMLISKKGMPSLTPFRSGQIWWTQGRFRGQLGRILGPEKLAILSPNSRYSELIMRQAHRENHMRDAGDTLFRSRNYAWIVNGRSLAKKIVRECTWCRRQLKETVLQRMGALPVERIQVFSRPFTHISVDLMGPFQVRGIANPRTSIKTWPIVFCCLNTGALHLELAHMYNTEAFLTQYLSFTSIRGRPTTVFSDKGSQLVKASGFLAAEDPESWDWERIRQETAPSGTTWKYTPPGCQFRNGLAESRIKALKHSLTHVLSGEGSRINYAEFRVFLSRCADVINSRPIGVRHHNKATDEILPLTPNLLLLGRSRGEPSLNALEEEEIEDGGKLTKRLSFLIELERTWWNIWFRQCFDALLPFNKWTKRSRNLVPGDLCLVRYDAKVGHGDFRLCRVKSVIKGDDNLVRTVTIEMRPRDKREKSLPYSSKGLISLTLAVNRLVLIFPIEELENVNNGFKTSDVMDDVGDEEVREEAVQQGLPGGGLHPSEQGGAGQELQTSGQHLDVQGRAHPAAGHYPGGQPDGRGHLRAQGGAEREESGGRHPEV